MPKRVRSACQRCHISQKKTKRKRRTKVPPRPIEEKEIDLKKDHCCYIITKKNRQSRYVGETKDMKHRLRQHRGEIKGGAKIPKKWGGDVSMCVMIKPFLCPRDAKQFEWRLKNILRTQPKKTKETNQQHIRRAIRTIFQRNQWTNNSIPIDHCWRAGQKFEVYWFDQEIMQDGEFVSHFIGDETTTLTQQSMHSKTT